MKADEVIMLFELEPLPFEGGFFKRTFYSKNSIHFNGKETSAGSAIYYLITPENFSVIHKIGRDEIFHFYAGDTVDFLKIENDAAKYIRFGNNLARGEVPQVVVPANLWQALRIAKPALGWSLVGTTVSPAFEYEDLIVGKRDELIKEFPLLRNEILRFTKVS